MVFQHNTDLELRQVVCLQGITGLCIVSDLLLEESPMLLVLKMAPFAFGRLTSHKNRLAVLQQQQQMAWHIDIFPQIKILV